MKTVALMQPYFFPYLGYFQLIAASDVFVFLDDVAFIKGGWINRNRALVHGKVHTISVPVDHASSHRSICSTRIATERDWRKRILRLLEQSYARAPFRDETLHLVQHVISRDHPSIGALAEESVRAVCGEVGLSASWQRSSTDHASPTLAGADRVLAICRSLRATRYVNAPGGKPLYSAEVFSRENIELRFLRPVLPAYSQNAPEFIPGLSIIDVLMCNSRESVRKWMEGFALE